MGAFFLVRGSPATHAAEVVVGSDGGPAIATGSVRLYPSFVALLQYTNNLVYESSDQSPTATWIKELSPGLVVEVPFSHSLFRAGWDVSFQNFGLRQSNWVRNQTGLLDLNLQFGNGTIFEARDDYHAGLLEVQVGDPGGEQVPFAGQKYRSNLGQIYVGHERPNGHRFGLGARVQSTTYLEPIVAPYYDESGWWVEPNGEWTVGPRTWIVWSASGGSVTLQQPRSTLGTADTRIEHELQVRCGARWALSHDAAFQFLVGPEKQAYSSQFPSTFRGIVGVLVVQSTAPVGLQWSVDLSRQAFPSVYRANNYYVSDQFTARAEMPRGTLLRFGGSAAFYHNGYPTDPENRVDRIFAIDTWMGIRQDVWVEWRVTMRYDVRFSTVEGADYRALTAGVGLVVGR